MSITTLKTDIMLQETVQNSFTSLSPSASLIITTVIVVVMVTTITKKNVMEKKSLL